MALKPGAFTSTTTAQLRAAYDGTNYTDFTTGATGDLTIAPTGGDTAVTGSLAVSTTSVLTGVVTASAGVVGNLTGDITGTAPAGTLTGATLASGVTSSSLTSVGTIGTGTWSATAIAVNKGGTAITSYAAGDILYASGTATLAKLAKGSDTQVLTLASGVPSWATPTVGDLTAIVAGTGLSGTDLSGPIPTLNVDASQTQITALGTIGTGVWQGTKVASAYLDDDTAHLSGTQTFSGAKTFSAALVASSTLAVTGASTLTGLVTATAGVKFGTTATLTEGAANRLDLATGDSLHLVSGGIGIGTINTTAGTLVASAAGPHAFGTATSALRAINVGGSFTGASGATIGTTFTHSLTGNANDVVYGVQITPSITEAASGTHAIIAGLVVGPTFVNGAATATKAAGGFFSTIAAPTGTVSAASLYVAGAATGATNNYALWVDAGETRLDGAVTMASTLAVTGASTLTGNVGVGGAVGAGVGLYLRSSAMTGTTQYGAFFNPTASSAATNALYGVVVTPATAAASFTAGAVTGVRISNATKGAGSTITTQYGLYIEDQTQGGTNWAIYTAGTAPVSFGGTLAVTGTTYIGDTANAKMTKGLTINQGAADNEILSLKSSDVNHGVTDATETDTYAAFAKQVSTGGLFINAVGSAGTTMFNVRAISVSDNTAKTTAALAPIQLNATKKNGTGITAPGADANLLVVQQNNVARFIFDAEGSGHADVSWVTF
jgi:hypothetical protein